MRKILSVLFSVTMLLGICSGCGKPDADEGRITVFVSFSVLEDFTEKVGGDRIHIETLVSAGSEPHDWEPSPSDIAKLEEAELLIYNGGGMEPWLDTLKSSLQNENLLFVDTSSGLSLMESAGEDEDSHAHTGTDPHIWLDPMNAKKQMGNIKEALIRKDPEGAQIYEQNYAAAADRLDDLDTQYKQTLKDFLGSPIVVSHEAYGYLCKAYGLKQVAVSGIDGEQEPSPVRMAEVVRFIKDNDVRFVFYAPSAGSRLAVAVAKEAGVSAAALDNLEALTEEKKKIGADYFTVMQENLEALKQAFS